MAIFYRKRRAYKYFLTQDYQLEIKDTRLWPKKEIIPGYASLNIYGTLRIETGYGWDGPSGPTIDTKSFMRGSLVHDVLYQFLREKLLPQECRQPADQLLKNICIEDGMSRLRAWYVYKSVQAFAGYAAKPDIIKAP